MRHLITVGTLALASGAALAQGSVTLSGIADAALRQVDNEGGSALRSLVSGSNSTSKLVFRGREDLGGGLSGSFHLEHGLALDTGRAINGFWDRRATVSLARRGAGELRLGRDYVPSYSAWTRHDPFSYIGVAGSSKFVSATPLGPIRSAFGSGANSTVRSSNSIQVLLPGGIGGVEGGLMVAAGEGGTAANGQNKVLGMRLGWAGGPLGFNVARTRTINDLTSSGAFHDTTVGGTVNFAPVRVNLVWRQFKQNQARQSNLMAALLITLGSSQIKASYIKADLAGRVGNTVIDNNDSSQIGLGYVYNLSRRTALYTSAVRIDNKGAATFVVPGGTPGLGAGRSSSGYEAGVRHSF